MAVRRHPKSKFYWIDVWVGEGKNRRRIRKSSGTEDFQQAKMMEQTYIGVDKGTTTRDRALEILNAVVPKEYHGLEIEAIAAYYKTCASEDGLAIKEKGLRDRILELQAFAEWAKVNTRVKYVDAVDAVLARSYRLYIQEEAIKGGKALKAKTINNHLGNLRTAWAAFKVRGKVTENPWGEVRAVRKEDEEDSGRAFTREEVARLLAEAEKRPEEHEWVPFIKAGLYTGLRRGDLEGLTWGEVDFTAKLILRMPNKTSRKRIKVKIPLHDELGAALARMRPATAKPDDLVFPWRHDNPSGADPHKGDIRFSVLLEKAKIIAGEGEVVSFHSLRHTFATWLAEAGVAQDVRMKMTGHTEVRTHERYDHQLETLKEAIGKI